MSGSQAQNRKKILKDRNNTSSHSLQAIALFQTSAPVSISRDPDCVPYWNDQVADWSKKLSLPTETGCVSSLMAQRSWFSQKITQQTNGNYLRISSPSLPSSFADYKESVPPGTDSNGNAAKNKKREKKVQTTRRAKRMKKADLTRSLKIRMYPNSSQKTLLRQWMGCARLVYNMVVANYRLGRRSTKQFFFRALLRLKIKHTKEWSFMDKVPYEVLDHAISDAIRARDEVITRNKENQHQHHVLHFRSKKNDRQTITIRAQYCREPLHFYVRLLHNNAILAVDPNHPRHKMKPPFHHEHRRRNHGWPNEIGKVKMDSNLIYERKLGYWTFVWVYGKSIRENQAEEIHVAAT